MLFTPANEALVLYCMAYLTDIDECGSSATPCQQDCVNTQGSYRCSCYGGYIMLANGTCAGEVFIVLLSCDNLGSQAILDIVRMNVETIYRVSSCFANFFL